MHMVEIESMMMVLLVPVALVVEKVVVSCCRW